MSMWWASVQERVVSLFYSRLVLVTPLVQSHTTVSQYQYKKICPKTTGHFWDSFVLETTKMYNLSFFNGDTLVVKDCSYHLW